MVQMPLGSLAFDSLKPQSAWPVEKYCGTYSLQHLEGFSLPYRTAWFAWMGFNQLGFSILNLSVLIFAVLWNSEDDYSGPEECSCFGAAGTDLYTLLGPGPFHGSSDHHYSFHVVDGWLMEFPELYLGCIMYLWKLKCLPSIVYTGTCDLQLCHDLDAWLAWIRRTNRSLLCKLQDFVKIFAESTLNDGCGGFTPKWVCIDSNPELSKFC